MTLLGTDWCFLSVLGVSAFLIGVSLRKEHARVSWRRLLAKPIAVSAGIVFVCFLGVGIFDSIHLNWSYSEKSGESHSRNQTILEHILFPLGTYYERTYSAPLALKAFNQEIFIKKGKLVEGYPQLKYSAGSLKNKHERNQFIARTVLQAAFVSLVMTGLLVLVVVAVIRKSLRQKIILPSGELLHARNTGINRKFVLPIMTFFLCLFFILLSYWLSRQLHILGTGKIGQDIFYYTIKSIRTGLVIGILTTLFMLPFALFFGICAGYFGGLIDDVIQYVYTTLSSMPGVLLITASVLSMQTYIANHPLQFPTLAQSADARLLALCLILGVTSWTSLCRILRAEALKWREIDFVQAAKVLGSSPFTILRKHLLPNMIPIIIITLVLDFSFLVLAEAVLSYVGVGVSPLTISWGNMINGARLELARDPIIWWPMGAAFSLMFILVLTSNLLVDALRDAFEP